MEKLIYLKNKASKIKYFFTDIDGTLTDASVYYNIDGEFLKKFSIRDGTGFFLLKHAGIKSGIITGEVSPIVEKRATKLNVNKLILGGVPKVDSIKQFLESEKLLFENIAYIGDDINDLKLLQMCGLSFAVGDADIRVKKEADIICKNNGGDGAFREAVESLLALIDFDIDKMINDNL